MATILSTTVRADASAPYILPALCAAPRSCARSAPRWLRSTGTAVDVDIQLRAAARCFYQLVSICCCCKVVLQRALQAWTAFSHAFCAVAALQHVQSSLDGYYALLACNRVSRWSATAVTSATSGGVMVTTTVHVLSAAASALGAIVHEPPTCESVRV